MSLYCPSCGRADKKRENHLVCSGCYRTYVEEASKSLGQGKILYLAQWALTRAKGLFEKVQKQFQQKQEDFRALQNEVSVTAFEAIKKATGGKFVPREVFNSALERKRIEVWKEKGGNRLFAEMKSLEELLEFLKESIKELEESQNNPKNHGNSGTKA
jgi:hypothetical protein